MMACCGGTGHGGCCESGLCAEIAEEYRLYLSQLVVDRWERDVKDLNAGDQEAK